MPRFWEKIETNGEGGEDGQKVGIIKKSNLCVGSLEHCAIRPQTSNIFLVADQPSSYCLLPKASYLLLLTLKLDVTSQSFGFIAKVNFKTIFSVYLHPISLMLFAFVIIADELEECTLQDTTQLTAWGWLGQQDWEPYPRHTCQLPERLVSLCDPGPLPAPGLLHYLWVFPLLQALWTAGGLPPWSTFSKPPHLKECCKC